MRRTVTNYFVLLCATLGVFVSLVLTYKHFRPETDIGCGFERSGCTGILNSAYGSLGPIPTALFGLGMYALFIGLALRRGAALTKLRAAEKVQALAYASGGSLTSDETNGTEETPEYFVSSDFTLSSPALDVAARPRAAVKQTDMLIWGLALCAFAVSWWLQYTALFVLQGFCPWCFTSAILVTLIFLVSSWDHLIDGRALTGEHKLLGGVGAFICVLLAFLYGPTIREQYYLNKMPAVKTPAPGTLTRDLLVTKDTQFKGDPNAPMTIVEFADYECPTCGRAVEMMDKALAAHPGAFRLGFRNMPLPIADHKWNKESAAAAEAAGLQGKFWEMHDLLFAHQKEREPKNDFQPATYDDYAKQLGLNVEKFRADRESQTIQRKVQKDVLDANAAGLEGTPTFYIIKGSDIRRIGSSSRMQAMMQDPNDPIWQTAPDAKAASAPTPKPKG